MERENSKISASTMACILQEVYDAVPVLMDTLAPEGWAQSPFGQGFMDIRQSFYDEYRNDFDENKSRGYFVNQEWFDPSDEEPMSIEEYLYIIFPPFHNDTLELFYILCCALLEITLVSTLYQGNDPTFYYFDEREFEGMVTQIAFQNGQISQDLAKVTIFAYPVPHLDELDIHHCLEVLFSILKKQGFQLNYWHDELVFIAQQQQRYEELLYSALEDREKAIQREQIKESIMEILDFFKQETIDPLDLSTIVDLYNRYEVCPLVLAYLHVYEDFPKGYPYLLSDYLF